VKILVVEDDSLLRAVIKKILKIKGFQVIEAGDGIDGYKIIQEVGSEISLLLTDINMPRMDGLSLAQSTAALYPRIPIILMTADSAWLPHPMGRYAVLRKPFLSQALVQSIRKLVAVVDCPGKNRWDSTVPNSGCSWLGLMKRKRVQVPKSVEHSQGSRHLTRCSPNKGQG
jgi:CheY-like chemotaxis protein